MEVNNDFSPKITITVYSAKIKSDNTIVLEELKGKAQTAALRAINQSLKTEYEQYVFKKNDSFVASKTLLTSKKAIILEENGKKIDLTGRVRVMNDADVAEIKQFASQYFTKIKDKEEKVAVKEEAGLRSWQPVKESDKKKGDAARRAIINANERYEELSNKENRSVEARSNIETGKKIRRFYDQMKNRDKQIEEFHKETRENTIN